MESLSYPGKFMSVLLDDGSNSGEESLLFEEIGVYSASCSAICRSSCSLREVMVIVTNS